MRPLMSFLVPLTFALATAVPAAAQPFGTLAVRVENVRSARGHVRVELCTSATFLTDNCLMTGAAPAQVGETVVTFENVPPGVYAAQAFHDVNDDHKVNRGVLGIPHEDLGFSRDAPLGLTGPKFPKAAFSHEGDNQVVTLRLRRF
jgi:uncharacterized protein (DUF2141 family)